MLRTKRDFNFDVPADTVALAYNISANDIIEFRLFSNDGFKLIDLTQQDNRTVINQNRAAFRYLIEFDGKVKLPVLGRVSLVGMTVREAEAYLQEQYVRHYNDPFVLLKVVNKRVIVFPGTGSAARVITLENDNTTLMEAIALAGGVARAGKAHRIKLIRGPKTDPEVFLIDLSTMEGIENAELVMQANDIVYVDTQFSISRELLQEITPILSLVTSTLLIWQIIRGLGATP